MNSLPSGHTWVQTNEIFLKLNKWGFRVLQVTFSDTNLSIFVLWMASWKEKKVFLNQPLHIKHELECKLQVEIQWPRHSRIVTHLLPKRSSGLKNSKGRDTKVKWVLGLTLIPTPQNAGYLSTYTTFTT